MKVRIIASGVAVAALTLSAALVALAEAAAKYDARNTSTSQKALYYDKSWAEGQAAQWTKLPGNGLLKDADKNATIWYTNGKSVRITWGSGGQKCINVNSTNGWTKAKPGRINPGSSPLVAIKTFAESGC